MKVLKSNRGIAIFETLPMIIIFITIISYGIGMWGVAHTAIQQSIGARAYAFSTFRQRSDLTFFSDRGPNPYQFKDTGFRLHSITTDAPNYTYNSGDPHYATERPISLRDTPPANQSQAEDNHNKKVHELDNIYREEGIGVNPIWVQTSYGICITPACGEN